jgi:hypothetical protein
MADNPLGRGRVAPSPADVQRSRMAGSNSLQGSAMPPSPFGQGYIDSLNTHSASALRQRQAESQQRQQETLARRYGAQMSLVSPGFSYNDGVLEHLTVRIDPSRSGLQNRYNQNVGRGYKIGPDGKITWESSEPMYNIGRALNQWWEMPDESRANIQRLLVRAGLLDPEAVSGRWGRIDPGGRDHQAWAQVLTMAARTGKEVFSLLDEFAEGMSLEEAMAEAGPKPPRRPDIALLSPEDIEEAADELGQSLMGRKLSDSERSRVVGHLHDLQRRQQKAMIDVGMSETGGGEFVQPTSPEVAIKNKIKKDHAVEVQGTEQVRQFDALLQMFGAR